jgi:hypothetical protein
MLFSSAGFSLFQIDLGTTPNIAPPSSLKNPVSITCSFIQSVIFSKIRETKKRMPFTAGRFVNQLLMGF